MRSFFDFAIAPINHQSEKEKKKNDVQGTEKKATYWWAQRHRDEKVREKERRMTPRSVSSYPPEVH